MDFVSKNVKVLEEGEMVVGGVRPNIVDEETPWKDTLLLAEFYVWFKHSTLP